MACNQSSSTSLCGNLSATVECIEQIYQGENKSVTIQLVDLDGYALNLDEVSEIQILLYDTRGYKIAKYYYPEYVDSSNTYLETYEVEEDVEIDHENDVWVDGLDINILQISLLSDSDSYYNSGDEYLNKGKISITINEKISNYLLTGALLVDIRIVKNDGSVYIIKCLQIGKIEKNKF
jgi:hypothetical protein